METNIFSKLSVGTALDYIKGCLKKTGYMNIADLRVPYGNDTIREIFLRDGKLYTNLTKKHKSVKLNESSIGADLSNLAFVLSRTA